MLSIRPAALDDLDAIVKIHIMEFPDFFLTITGKRFLKQLYRCFIIYPNGICLVACENNETAGFVAGTICPESFFKMVKRRRWLMFAFSLLPAIFLHPFRILRKIAAAIFYRGEVPPSYKDAALLSSVAVRSSNSHKGIGRQLVFAFLDKVRNAKIDAVFLTTDKYNNDRVNKFYLQLGFFLESSFMQSGRRVMNRYVFRIPLRS
jgi:ribosomal protein S18 acetylase RimI-like enzyme